MYGAWLGVRSLAPNSAQSRKDNYGARKHPANTQYSLVLNLAFSGSVRSFSELKRRLRSLQTLGVCRVRIWFFRALYKAERAIMEPANTGRSRGRNLAFLGFVRSQKDDCRACKHRVFAGRRVWKSTFFGSEQRKQIYCLGRPLEQMRLRGLNFISFSDPLTRKKIEKIGRNFRKTVNDFNEPNSNHESTSFKLEIWI